MKDGFDVPHHGGGITHWQPTNEDMDRERKRLMGEKSTREVQAARDEGYKLAVVAMLEQALSLEELEEVCYLKQWALERGAIDKDTACRAVVSHCDRVVHERQRSLASDGTVAEEDRAKYATDIQFMQQVAARWEKRCPSALVRSRR